jgi:hypothetical protein
MVTSREMPPLASLPEWLAAIRQGLTSLTVIGPSPMLEATHRDALSAIARRLSRQEREMALSQAWQASAQAAQSLQAGNPPAAARAVEEMYSRVRAAISASRLD